MSSSSSSTTINFTATECETWKNRPNCNPRTNRIIQTNGRVYNSIVSICGNPNVTPDPPSAWRNGSCTSSSRVSNVPVTAPSAPRAPISPVSVPSAPRVPIAPVPSVPQRETAEQRRNHPSCIRWRENPNCNPISNTYIYTRGPTFRDFKTRCGNPEVLPDHIRYRHDSGVCHPPNTGMTQEQINEAQRIREMASMYRPPQPVTSSSKSMSLSPQLSSSIKEEEDIKISCKDKYSNFRDKYKRLSNKLIRMCNMYSKECAISDMAKVKEEISKKVSISTNMIGIFINVNNSKIAELFYNYYKFKSENREKFNLMFRVKLFMHSVKYFEIKNGNMNFLQGIGIGVARDFYQGVIDELKTLKIFIKPSGSDRYFLNPYMDVNKIFKNVITSNPNPTAEINPLFVNHIIHNNTIHYRDFYEFLGKLLSFFIFNDFGFNFRLSNGLLGKLLYKTDDITSEDLISYAAFDFSNEFNTTFANLMRGSNSQTDYIGSIGLNFNDEIDIEDPKNHQHILDHEINDYNFINYLELYSNEILNNPYKNIERVGKTKLIKNIYYLQGFILGFKYMKHHVFNKAKPTIYILDQLLYKNISLSDINMIISKLNEVMPRIISRFPNKTVLYNTILEMFISILNDDGDTFPFSEIGIDNKPDDYNVYFLQFIEKLIRFWTGFGYIDESLNYQFELKDSSINKLPQSHMCFATIDFYIVNNLPPTRDVFYKNLVKAVMGVEVGVGNL
jgi:hypothetical protein